MTRFPAIAVAIALLTGGSFVSTNLTAPLIVAHRGASSDAPENTLAAFRLAWRQNADAIEGDFHLTKDGHIVCMHDDTTKRTAGRNLVIGKSTLQQLRQLDVGSWKGKKWSNEKIPTIEEVLATVPAGRRVYVHIKCGAEIVPYLHKALRGSSLSLGQMVILTTDKTVVAEAKRQLPGTRVVWLADFSNGTVAKERSAYMRQLIEALRVTGADGLSINAHSAIDNDFAAVLRRNQIAMHVWDVDDPVTMAHSWYLGSDSLTTDHPGWFRMLQRRK